MTRRPLGSLALILASLAACTVTGGDVNAPLPAPREPTASGRSASASAPASKPTPTASPDLATRCATLAGKLDLDAQVGQLFMVAVSSEGSSGAAERVLRRHDIGSVLLLGNTTSGLRAVARVTAAARRATGNRRDIRPLVAADQEGGQVQRLQGEGFTQIPSASEQADQSDAELTANATRWGRQLRRAGVDVDLAPVADLVPDGLTDLNRPIGVLRRGYGSDPDVIAAKVSAFVRGMDAAGVATSLKHFPGLGRVRGNTDFEADVVDRDTRRDDPGLAGFRAGVAAGADLVMVASARYRRIDPDQRAAFSPTVMGLIRDELDFTGVIISDDLSAAAFEDVRPRDRALRFIRAGGDLAIVGDPDQVLAMVDAVVAEAKDDPGFAAAVTAAAARVVTLKARRSLAGC